MAEGAHRGDRWNRAGPLSWAEQERLGTLGGACLGPRGSAILDSGVEKLGLGRQGWGGSSRKTAEHFPPHSWPQFGAQLGAAGAPASQPHCVFKRPRISPSCL